MFKLGDKVITGVYISTKFQPMASGIIVGVHGGYCDVDTMSLHGGAPWIIQYRNTHMKCED